LREFELPFDQQLLVCATRIRRQIAGAGGKVSILVTLPDQDQFDAITLPGQIETQSDHHGASLKAHLTDSERIIAVHKWSPEADQARPSSSV
jgi:hypothetical protein